MVASLGPGSATPAVIELTAVIAFANFTTRSNVALGIESDGFAAAVRPRSRSPRAPP